MTLLGTSLSALQQYLNERQMINESALSTVYEKWLREDYWLVHTQAIPLLVGVDPNDWPKLLSEATISEFNEHAVAALLEILRSRDSITQLEDSESLSIAPLELHEISQSQAVKIPVQFSKIAEFIRKVTFSSVPVLSHVAPQDPAAYDKLLIQNKVITAAFNIFAKSPERCFDANGFVNGVTLAKIIKTQSVRWFDSAEPPIQEVEMARLIEKCLE